MTLDMLKVSRQVAEMAREMAHHLRLRGPRLAEALEILDARADDWEALAAVARASQRRLPVPLEPLNVRRVGTAPPPNHVVIATDGSQIEPDRHSGADFFLLNVGSAVVRYGANSFAELTSEPTLFFKPEDTYITHHSPHGLRRVPIQDRHLAAKRAGREIARAASLAAAWCRAEPDLVVLADGTLALWVLEERPDDFLRQELLAPYVEQLQRMRDLDVPLASYISRPRSVEVSGLLQEAVCLGPDDDGCERCLAGNVDPCVFDRLPDRELFSRLPRGERSALFEMTLPQGLVEFYDDLVPRFFYLNVGSEIARVEVPPWTAEDPTQLDLVQAVVLDQCQKGLGYPNVLARAHEQALVSGQDRLAFEYLRDAMQTREGVSARASEKLHSKRIRAV
jgi:hypothetical protein